jgi:hypothetical protein
VDSQDDDGDEGGRAGGGQRGPVGERDLCSRTGRGKPGSLAQCWAAGRLVKGAIGIH